MTAHAFAAAASRAESGVLADPGQVVGFGGGERYWRVVELATPQQLAQAFALRFRVYCEERGFLPVADYPDGLESDAFDASSLHFGTFDRYGELVGTARLVMVGPLGLPFARHCALDRGWAAKLEAIPGLVEISRLAISRAYRRRASDGFYGIDPLSPGSPPPPDPRRTNRHSIVISLFKAMYQAAHRHGFTHAVSAMERSLFRLLTQYAFPLERIGPECDYFGPVMPFVLEMGALERALARRLPELLHEFRRGLEPEPLPRLPASAA